jgi:GNAT superfamily N-acetyltransferase
MTGNVRVREATVPELPAVLNVLDGAALAVNTGRLRSAVDRGDVLVAVVGGAASGTEPDDERVLGALVLDGQEITAVAVRRRRRDQGIGTVLVEAAAERRERLVAVCDPEVRPFWNALGFEIEPADEPERYRGVWRGSDRRRR